MHRRPISLFIAAALTTTGCLAAGPPTADDLAVALAQTRQALSVAEGRLEGAGAELLRDAARDTPFVLVGEDHGVAEVPVFTEALFRNLRPLGFETYVTEVGPWSARHLVALASDASGLEAFDAFFRATPFAVPFATYEEEARLLRAVAESSSLPMPIWGIDQEFVLSPQRLLADLRERATDPATREALDALVGDERAAFRTLVAAGDPSAAPMFMSRPLPESWPAIRSSFERGGDADAVAVLGALEASRTVYGHFFAGRYHHNNADRAKLMKRQLRDYFTRYGRERRLLVKMGSNHMARGMSVLGIPDIGNLLSELAELKGASSLHILVAVRAGARNGWLPFLPATAASVPIDDRAPAYRFVRPLLDAAPASDGWQVYDLRPLRPRHAAWAKLAPEIEPTLLGYDVLVVIDEGHPATVIAADAVERMR